MTSPDEIRKNKENIAKLDEKIRSILKEVEEKNAERTENFTNLGVRVTLIEDKINELKNQFDNHTDNFSNLEMQVDKNTKFINDKLINIDERFNDNKNLFRDNLSKIIELQGKVKNLIEKSENVVDWGDQITSLQNNQKKLFDTTNK